VASPPSWPWTASTGACSNTTSARDAPPAGQVPLANAGPEGGPPAVPATGSQRAVSPELSAAVAMRRAAVSSAGKPKRVTTADLDRWAESSAVRGHVHSRPSGEPYALSQVCEFGDGTGVPGDWVVRLRSATGLKSVDSVNQDSFSYTVLECGWIICIACDGHGDEGEVVAGRVARMLPMLLSQLLPAVGLEEALPKAFAEAQLDLERCYRNVQAFSGTTVATMCIHPERQEAWIAYAGDSRVVIGDLDTGLAVYSTGEHKAHDPDENARLKDKGAQIITKRYADGEVVSRVFVPKSGVPGLAMSRSLGDGCLKKYGVTAHPEVHNVTSSWAQCTIPMVVLASDGLWDTISIEDTISALAKRRKKGMDVALGIEKLVRRSQRLWIAREGDYCDDVTVLMVAPGL